MTNTKRTRREFAKSVALLGTAPLAAVSLAAPAAAQPPGGPRAATAQAMSDIVRARFAKHLSEEQLKSVGQRIQSNLAGAEAMHRFALSNGDEPAFLFVAQHD